MTEQRHTPGPWEGFPPDDPTEIKTLYGSPQMDESQLIPVVKLGSGKNRIAKAVLIASAPDLVAENERLRGKIRGIKETGELDEDITPPLRACRVPTDCGTHEIYCQINIENADGVIVGYMYNMSDQLVHLFINSVNQQLARAALKGDDAGSYLLRWHYANRTDVSPGRMG